MYDYWLWRGCKTGHPSHFRYECYCKRILQKCYMMPFHTIAVCICCIMPFQDYCSALLQHTIMAYYCSEHTFVADYCSGIALSQHVLGYSTMQLLMTHGKCFCIIHGLSASHWCGLLLWLHCLCVASDKSYLLLKPRHNFHTIIELRASYKMLIATKFMNLKCNIFFRVT